MKGKLTPKQEGFVGEELAIDAKYVLSTIKETVERCRQGCQSPWSERRM